MDRIRQGFFRAITAFLALALGSQSCLPQWEGKEELLKNVEKTFGDPPGMVRLDPTSRVWADKKNRRIVVDGYVALRAGQLEMLACPAFTKEHESVVAVFSKAQVVHAGLLAIGAKQGSPVKWEPEYSPPTGSEIQVLALWRDAEGNRKSVDTREWVRVVGTEDKVLDTNFVFAGSILWEDPDTGEKRYMAESGDLICVSNFSTATLDIPMMSSQVNSGLMFAAFTERIPPSGTPIRLVLQVVEPGKAALRDDSVEKPLPASAGAPKVQSPAEETDDPPAQKGPADFDQLNQPA